MRDLRVFGVDEDELFPRDEDEDAETPRPIESLPDRSGPLSDIDAINRYGLRLKDIRTHDVTKCSSSELFSAYNSQTSVTRRLFKEVKCFIADQPSYISVAPIADNIPGTPYEDGVFFIRFDFPEEYPYRAPVCNFITKIYHPNIANGRICVNILEREWGPVFCVSTLLLSICLMLSDPFFDDSLVPEIAEQYMTDPVEYERIAKGWTRKYAKAKVPSEEELDQAGRRNADIMTRFY